MRGDTEANPGKVSPSTFAIYSAFTELENSETEPRIHESRFMEERNRVEHVEISA